MAKHVDSILGLKPGLHLKSIIASTQSKIQRHLPEILLVGLAKPSEHEGNCLSLWWKSALKRTKYKLDFPHYCRKCNGWGWLEVGGDWVPYGSINVQLPSSGAPCEECCAGRKGKCPRCGMEEMFPYESWCETASSYEYGFDQECWNCGFIISDDPKKATQGLPMQHECYCWEIKAERELDKVVEDNNNYYDGYDVLF